ncbi:MAG: hypoxanthine phosphoribosyltransferase [Ruminococcaceae bacterium]|nr:hypoxanthine phosphoribosyltransferase [Oscillospiraceae bacterium]
MIYQENDIKKILFSKEEIKARIEEMGKQITEDYKDAKSLLVIGILKGSCVFYADLIREINLPIEIEFMSVSSYQDSSMSSGEVKIVKDVGTSVALKHVLFVEDIIDTGFTMSKVMEMFEERGAASVKLCSLLSKPDRRKVEISIDYLGFTIPDEFVIGYGLDYAERYRNLPFVGVLDESVYL